MVFDSTGSKKKTYGSETEPIIYGESKLVHDLTTGQVGLNKLFTLINFL